MKIKRYTGNNTQEAMLKVKMDMGNDAIILHTRNIKQKGWLSFLSKPMVEILAAIDDEYGARRTVDLNKAPGRVQKPIVQLKNPALAEEAEIPKENEQINEIESKVNRLEGMIRRMYENSQGAAMSGVTKIPINKLQNAVSAQQETVKRPSASIQSPAAIAPRSAESNSRSAESNSRPVEIVQAPEPKALEPLVRNLENQEVEKVITSEVAKKVKGKLSNLLQVRGSNIQGLNQIQPTDVIKIVKQELEEIIGEPQSLKLREDGRPTVAIFLGPTGVGKTTTIAKIAANYALIKNKRVALITADTYRVAAVDQLKTYAEILSMPVSVVYSADEMKPAIEENDSADLILIDTAGISHKKKQQLEELKSVIDSCGADEVYLVMSATTSWKNCQDVIQNHKFLEDYKLIFTKLDEAPSMGLILNARYYSRKSLSYVTTGQSVPDDIDLVNVDKLAKNLLRSTAQ